MSAVVPTLSSKRRGRRLEVWHVALAAILIAAAWGLAQLDWALVWRISPLLLKGLGVSFAMTGISVGVGLPLGIVLAAGRISRIRPLRWAATSIIEIVRATPQLMVIFWIYFTYPAITGNAISPWTGAAAALSLIAGAYLAEVVRGGLLSIPAIQSQSAEVMGLTRIQTLTFILLPQACRNMLPAFITTIIMMFKTSSLVYVIGILDLFRAVILVNNRVFAPYTLYTVMALIYFVCCYAMSRLIRWLDPKYSLAS
jgi:polar amino acid transport system permease protein